jgi:sugar phosphate isomerase/epimerase
MTKFKTIAFYLVMMVQFFSCSQKSGKNEGESVKTSVPERKTNQEIDHASVTSMENLLAWCIVPFDIKQRTPAERINMLKELGFKRYAYDWREEHLDEMAEEFRLASENGIEVTAVWLWIDANSDQPGKLSDSNEKMLSIVKNAGLQTQVWTGFHSNFFGGLSDEDAVKKGVEMTGYLAERVGEIGCRLAFYNHGDWFGEPENQVKIISGLPDQQIGIVYNFHHAHEQINRLPEIIDSMKPYLWVVNLNGMRVEGPKILPIGSGDREAEMIDMFLQACFTGPFGILGHIEVADVKEILENNLEGLKNLYD